LESGRAHQVCEAAACAQHVYEVEALVTHAPRTMCTSDKGPDSDEAMRRTAESGAHGLGEVSSPLVEMARASEELGLPAMSAINGFDR
jgi:hypothetical protein